jgi:hypothetical protein
MKKIILTLLAVTMVGAGARTAMAGDREWALAGKVLTGVAAASIISRAVEPAPVYAYSQNYYPYSPPAYSYCPPPAPRVVYAPAPVVVYRAPAYPVYAAPAPVVGFRFDFGGGHHGHRHHGHGHHRHGRW